MPFRPEMLLLFQIINKKAPVRQEVKKWQGLGQGHDGPALLQFVLFLHFFLYSNQNESNELNNINDPNDQRF